MLAEMEKVEETMDTPQQSTTQKRHHRNRTCSNGRKSHQRSTGTLRRGAQLFEQARGTPREYDGTDRTDEATSKGSEVTLTPIPILEFDGDIWEWEPLWQSFERNVHSRNIDDV
ncbi:hypothetical protein GCK32_000246 [Trichostrongylus colubriformis]|uniref:Uncharacterized protein n=1 Tax=Trichostrongylus colubriformis TaxID=6319 RepID=A0AAN8IF16_TRICO